MGPLAELSAWLENKKRVARRNIEDITERPNAYGEMAADRWREDLGQQLEGPDAAMNFVGGPLSVGRVGKGAIGFVKDFWPDATAAVRGALQGTHFIPAEHAVARTPDMVKMWTSNLPDEVRVSPDINRILTAADPRRSFLMHTHLRGDVGPSLTDLTTDVGAPGMMEMIASPAAGNPLIAFRKHQPIGADYDQFNRAVFQHITTPQVKDFLTESGFLRPGSLDAYDFGMVAGPHTYMRNLGLGDKIDYLYNDLGPLSRSNPNRVGKMLDAYWNEFLPE